MVLVSSGIFAKHSHMTLMIKWSLMFLLARMETVMIGKASVIPPNLYSLSKDENFTL